MSTPLEVAGRRYRTQQTLTGRARVRARRTWLALDKQNLTGSFDRTIGPLLTDLTVLQVAAAQGADPYQRRIMAALNADVDSDGTVNPVAFGGRASDGRPLDTLLYRPVIKAKQLIGDGAPEAQALRVAGQSFITLAAQQVTDAGRVADGLSTFANRHTAGYYRMLQTPSCSRCAILAGKFFRKNAGFQRHPRCDCVHIPVVEADDSLAFDARRAVEQGQVRGLSQNENRAILDGADPAKVVNARRGMDPAGLTTREGTRTPGAPTRRATPEGIYRVASDRDEALTLLRRFGYLH